MLKLELIGNLGKDAEVKTLESGKTVIQFTVAVTEKREESDFTTWVNCKIWKNADQSTKISKYLLKGTKVYLEGKPSASGFTNKNGELITSLDLFVTQVELLGSNTKQTAEPNKIEPEDDLPF